MQTVGEATTSRGGIKSPQQPVQALERQVGTKAESQVPGFAQAFSSVALTPTIASEASSKVIAATGVKLAKIQGDYFADKNPNMHVMPSFTESDKAFENAYTSRSEQILGTQANELINQSREEAASAGQMSEGVINTFQASTAKGLQGILGNAPDSIRNQMMYQYQNQANEDAHKMRLKMISSQQEQQAQAQMSYNNNRVDNSFNTTFAEGLKEGSLNLELFKQDLDRQQTSGVISPKQHDALYDNARMNTYIGAFSKDVHDARDNEQLPEGHKDSSIQTAAETLSGIYDKLPKEMPELEKNSIVGGVVGYAQKLRAAEDQSNQLKLSELNRATADGTINSSMLAAAESSLPPTEFNNFMSKFWTSTNKRSTEEARVRNISSNFNDPYTMADASPSDINKSFSALVNKSMADDPHQDEMVVKTGVAKSGGAEVPAFTNELNTMLTRGSSEQAYTAMLAYNEVSSYQPQNIKSMSKEGAAMAAVMGDLHQIAQVPLNDAWEQARDAIFNQKPEIRESRESQYKDYYKQNLSTEDQRLSRTSKLLDVPFFTDVPNMPYVTNSTMRLWKDWYVMTGDKGAADKLTKDSLKKNYDLTYANGLKQKVFMPVEMMAGIGTDAPEIVHQDISNSISGQLKETKDAYDAGDVDWYYRVDDGSINAKGSVKVERIYRGEEGKQRIDKYNVQVSASQNLQRTQNPASPYSGYYDVSLIDGNGFPVPLSVVSRGGTNAFAYRPNLKFINEAYTFKHNNGLSNHQMERERIQKSIDKMTAPSFRQGIAEKSRAATDATLGGL